MHFRILILKFYLQSKRREKYVLLAIHSDTDTKTPSCHQSRKRVHMNSQRFHRQVICGRQKLCAVLLMQVLLPCEMQHTRIMTSIKTSFKGD